MKRTFHPNKRCEDNEKNRMGHFEKSFVLTLKQNFNGKIKMNEAISKNIKREHEEQGFVLIVAIIIMALLLLLVVPFLTQMSTEHRSSERSSKSMVTLSLAEAGIERAIWELNHGDILSWSGDDNLRTLTLSDFQTSNGKVMGDIAISITDPEGDNPVIEATGSVTLGSQTVSRIVRVELQYDSPIPAPTNAINIYGSPSKHATMKILEHDKKNDGEIVISGFDAGRGSNRLALGVGDADTLDAIINDLGKHLKKGGDLEDTLIGNPVNTYTDKNGNTFTASVGQVDTKGFDADLMEEYAKILADNARSLARTQTIDLGGEEKDDAILDPDGDGYVRLGSHEDDVTYVTNGKLKLEKGLVIEGTGTLVIDGGKLDLKHATFDWDGDIYILGNEKKGDAQFKVRHASVDITGDIFLLGSDNGKVKMDLHNDDGKNDGYTKIKGSILAMGGTGDKSKAEFKAHHGDLDIEGFITMCGTKIKLDIFQQAPHFGKNDIRIEGGICLLVPEAKKEKKEKAEIMLHARGGGEGDFVIQYNSDIVKAAVKRLGQKVGLPPKYNVVSWQETHN